MEELTRVNAIYDALIGEVDSYGGSVISFAGDAITCWFDTHYDGEHLNDKSAAMHHAPSAIRAAACGIAMQPTITRSPASG